MAHGPTYFNFDKENINFQSIISGPTFMMLFFPKYNKWGPTIIYYTLTCALRAHVNSTHVLMLPQ